MSLELLAPAGDADRLAAAIRYGADAVYLGSTEFGMRASPQNFSLDALTQAVALAHDHGVLVYLTVNTLPHPDETDALPDFLVRAAATGVDAFIIADIGIMALTRKLLPNMAIHASTQTGIVNHLTATELYNMGASRVVLARELSLEEIANIRQKTPPQLGLECFVHGAMCMSVSGRCVISSYLTGRDANRGECTQPCRWSYQLMEEKRPGVLLPVFEDEQGTTILSARDLCMIEHLDELQAAGVTSFKLEGRAKSAYYTAVVTNAYRAATDALKLGLPLPQWALGELDKISHREYSQGFYFGREPVMQSYKEGGYLQDWEVSAIVERCEGGRLYLSEKNRFAVGDELELLCPAKAPVVLTISAIYDADNTPIDSAKHPMMKISVPYDGEAAEGSMLRHKKAIAL